MSTENLVPAAILLKIKKLQELALRGVVVRRKMLKEF